MAGISSALHCVASAPKLLLLWLQWIITSLIAFNFFIPVFSFEVIKIADMIFWVEGVQIQTHTKIIVSTCGIEK